MVVSGHSKALTTYKRFRLPANALFVFDREAVTDETPLTEVKFIDIF